MIKIDQLFTTALIAANTGLDIVWENGANSIWGGSSYSTSLGVYEPTNDRAYIEAFLLPNDITPYGLSSTNETDGLFRCILRYPANNGAIAAKTKADEIMAAFPVGARLIYSGQKATVTSQARRQGTATDENWYSLVLSFNYIAYLAR
tara:strand:- start:638 stop:1081 length:444 start_codon:yes stop_codon:yes gene_type:complete